MHGEGLTALGAIGLVGVAGVGAQWIAWRMQLPAIVLMLIVGLIFGPVLGVLNPQETIGDLSGPIISLAVAIILFEGGLTLNLRGLRDAASGVRRLIFPGAVLGWVLSVLALHYVAGLSWETSWVFGGIMIVTGPTVIAPLLRQARLARRPAALLQWEAIANDPLGALAAVLAFEIVLVARAAETAPAAIRDLVLGILLATGLGFAVGRGLAWSFRNARVPEYMKVPVIFVAVLGAFSLSDALLHESGLLTVTILGLVLANSRLASLQEVRRFKEHATVLLVSGVFILLAASFDVAALERLDWRAPLFVAVVILLVRPAAVFLSLLGTDIPQKERVLVAFTGPRGVVLMAVAGLFGERLTEAGVADGYDIIPLAFLLVAATVVIHGFSLKPLAQALGLSRAVPGLMILGANRFTLALSEALTKAEVPVILTDTNHYRLGPARQAGVETYSGDILSEAAEHRVELIRYNTLLAASDNEAHNTLVATDLAPEFGRENVWQLRRAREDSPRHALPASLGGRTPLGEKSLGELEGMMAEGWRARVTKLTEEFTFDDWRARQPEALVFAVINDDGLKILGPEDEVKSTDGTRLVALVPPDAAPAIEEEKEAEEREPLPEGSADEEEAAEQAADAEAELEDAEQEAGASDAERRA
ncbi:cation:proton antiporter [Pseudoroseicyclus tamaricis]|uniref:Sodium:proton antiporter n=1 Tax=Pseudoroseicyclus tamaricis TaxID=2705421 RepID=A0A6B2JJE6_9RHOB|nr:sodium:proton antiporter [Pseudoroseicyclus tamaricis]NDV01561.1 sodium:proton antiporter [Pseudoroseicyclus tamaricis]